jgi:capsule polysaccharide export protein KpsC/LpsZ
LESEVAQAHKTWTTLFYKPFPDLTSFNLQGLSTPHKMDGVFSLIYDLAWVDESIPNIDNVMYVQSAQYLKPTCYRVTLNSINSAEIDVQKVYR